MISPSIRQISSTVAFCALIASMCAFYPANVASAPQSVVEQPDKYTWLEDIYGDKQLAWVKAENMRTANVIEKNPRYATNQAEALKVLDSPERLAFSVFRSGDVYNTWRDADHVRGIIRRTTLEDYKSADPKWQTVVDYDALSKADNKSWVGKGEFCLEPTKQPACSPYPTVAKTPSPCVKSISNRQVRRGRLCRAQRQKRVDWVDKDTLLIGRDWGPGTMSEAGYPITVREWKRGEPLENAREIYHGDVKDNGYGDNAFVHKDAQGHQVSGVVRSINTFEAETYLFESTGPVKLALPLKSNIDGLLDGQLIVSIDDDWTPAGSTQTFAKGSELSLDLKATEKDPIHLKPTVIFAPTATEFLQEGLSLTKNALLLTTLDNVQGRAYVYTYNHDGKWSRKRLPVADNSSVSIVSTSATDDDFFLTVYGFLTPPTILLGNAADGSLSAIKSQKPLFDASNDVVEQFHATSKDGTQRPLLHRPSQRHQVRRHQRHPA